MGVFTAEEVLNLDIGQAFVRSGAPAKTFNLETYPKIQTAEIDPTVRIQMVTRSRNARLIAEVEAELDSVRPITLADCSSRKDLRAEPEDPSENDLVI